MPMLPSRRWLRSFICALPLFGPLGYLAGAENSPPAVPAAAADSPQNVEFFEKQVRPLLVARCQKCHSGEKPKGNLRLDSRVDMMTGGDTGPAIVPGDPKESLLVDAINYGDTYQMPPKSKLPAEEIAVLTRWVELGAPWPVEQGVTKADKKKFDLVERRGGHWAWQPVQPVAPPAVHNGAWPLGSVDRFVLAKLEAAGLQPAPPAEKRTLLRRLYFDLIGLPPTPADVAAFLADDSPGAVAKVADQLLASPQFGERWGRHWLDLVRYAESRGHEFEPQIPNAWQYRDYVIRALNADVPYDQFLTEHIAGDLVEKPRLSAAGGFNESILGTGFWFLGEEVHSPVDIRQDEMDRLDNRIDVMSKTFLGLTVACARCHDHKFDAISQRDYYALAGFLISSGYRQVRHETLEKERQIAGDLDVLRISTRHNLASQLAAAERPALEHTADYLLAARQAILDGFAAPEPAKTDATKKNPSPADDLVAQESLSRLTGLAKDRSLDVRTLAAWAGQLQQARGNAHHPLHAFALVAFDKTAADPARCAELLVPLAGKLAAELNPKAQPSDAASKSEQLIVDYADPRAPWFEDGFGFGLGPIRTGDLLLGAKPDGAKPDGAKPNGGADAPAPPLQLATAGYAERDLAWKGLKLAPGTERDYGGLGNWDRAGCTLRTPEATLGTGKVWYLVKGSGRVYAVVNSHLIVGGPLHGAVLKEWKGDANNWQWIQHDLVAYAGHHAHFEFSPLGDEPLAIARVVDSNNHPAVAEFERPDPPNRLLADLVAGPSRQSIEALARGYQQLCLQTAEHLGAAKIAGSAQAVDEARLANWLLEHAELWSAGQDERLATIGTARQQFVAIQAHLIEQIAVESHTAMAMFEGNGQDELLLIRGNSKTPGEPVPRRLLEAIAGSDPLSAGGGSGRLQLARAMLAPSNPLTARVMVNRIWHHLFGQGIVASVDNFGVLGQAPTHPELLDYLADEFVREGWSVKRLIRELVLTRTYQMSSQPDAFEQQDPQDLLLHRMRIRRLEGEVIRDAMLAVSGRLDRTQFGPSVPVHLTPYMDGRGKPASGPLDGNGRRSIYISIRRNFLSPMMLAFDMPIPFNTVGRRNVSNVPSQALIMMNDPLVVEQAAVWAKRALALPNLSPPDRVGQLYEQALGRPAAENELRVAQEFLQQQARELGIAGEGWQSDARVWADLCHVLLNSKEFIFVN
jgi:hypothetical protein